MRMGGLPAYIANAADFDGTNDYMLRGAGFTGAADSSTGIFSCWIRLDGGDGANRGILLNALQSVIIRRDSTNKIFIAVYNTAGTASLDVYSATNYTASTTWLNILCSWSTNFTAGNKIMNFYVNSVDDKGVSNDANGAFTVDYTDTNWCVGTTNIFGGEKFNGCMSEIYFAPGQYLDFTNSANRAKFISGGKPVDLGTDGSIPTGTAPILYLREVAASFNTNSGTGGNMTITGTLDIASTSPSD